MFKYHTCTLSSSGKFLVFSAFKSFLLEVGNKKKLRALDSKHAILCLIKTYVSKL